MGIYDSRQWLEDISRIVETLPGLSELSGKAVLVTGASGLVCSALIDVLIRYNETHEREAIRILAAGRNEEKILRRFAPYTDKSYLSFVEYDATKSSNLSDTSCEYIIHGASNSSPRAIMKAPVDTMTANFDGLKSLLEHARSCKTKRVLYISSSEVYGKSSRNEPLKEEDYGYIDLLNPRNSYSVGKRAAETLCVSYATEYGAETVIARPGHIYGPTAAPEDDHVSSAWAYAAARGENIVMKSDGCQLRSYCYCLDCASAILTILLKGENMTAYNVSNSHSVITIKEMAEFLAEAGGVKLLRETADEQEQRGFNPMTNSSLDSTKLEALGWKGNYTAQEGFSHTVDILRERIGSDQAYAG